jgi:hypothetical protein
MLQETRRTNAFPQQVLPAGSGPASRARIPNLIALASGVARAAPPHFRGMLAAALLFGSCRKPPLPMPALWVRLHMGQLDGLPHANGREAMKLEGGCYCGAVRYVSEGEPVLRAQCHCRACQHITGGAPNMFMLMPPDGFRYVKGESKRFKRPDLDNAVTREFCETCGTHLVTRRPGLDAVVLKVGTLDDPSLFGGPAIAIFTEDKQAFHLVADGVREFEKLPPQR